MIINNIEINEINYKVGEQSYAPTNIRRIVMLYL